MTIPEVNLLPFLSKKRHDSGLIVKQREPDQVSGDEVQPDSLEDCADRLMKAIASNSKSQVAEALKDIFQELKLQSAEPAEQSADKE